MQFEYDKYKDEQNIEKHKVSFQEVQQIWDDENLLVLHANKRGEKRMLAIGRLYCVVYTVVYTKRKEVIRIISARKATKKERDLYEKHCNK